MKRINLVKYESSFEKDANTVSEKDWENAFVIIVITEHFLIEGIPGASVLAVCYSKAYAQKKCIELLKRYSKDSLDVYYVPNMEVLDKILSLLDQPKDLLRVLDSKAFVALSGINWLFRK